MCGISKCSTTEKKKKTLIVITDVMHFSGFPLLLNIGEKLIQVKTGVKQKEPKQLRETP